MQDDNVSQGEDVTQEVTAPVETDTTDAPSSENETAQETTEESSADSTKESENHVPYSRFKEVNDKVRDYELKLKELESKVNAPATEQNPQEQAVKEQLRQMGFVSKEEVEAELKRRDEDKALQDELSRLEKQYDGKDGRPKFDRSEIVDFAIQKQVGDLETAYQSKYMPQLIDWHVKDAIAKSRGIKTETSDGSGSSEAGTTNGDLKEAIKDGDRNALHLLLKRVSKGS
jgi:hypothetical protein